jgi:antitoxin CcdA
MSASAKRKTSLTLSATALDTAKELGINISAVAEGALLEAISEARKQACEAQATWHKENGHPLADIIAGPGGDTWTS